MAVAARARELNQVAGSLDDGSPLGRARNAHAAAAPELQDTFLAQSPQSPKSAFDLMKIGQEIQAAVRPPDRKASGPLDQILSTALSVGSELIEGPAATGMSLFLTGMEAVGAASGADGSALLGDLEVKMSELSNTLFTRFELTRGGLTGMGQIIVSDYGKLTEAARRVNLAVDQGGWKWPATDTPIRTTINKGAKRWFYSQLMPVAWVRWEFPGLNNARDWNCDDPSRRFPVTISPFRRVPDSAQYKSIVGLGDDLRPRTLVHGLGIRDPFAGGYDDWDARPPPSEMVEQLFKPLSLDPASNNLGLYPLPFFESNFDTATPPRESGRSCPR